MAAIIYYLVSLGRKFSLWILGEQPHTTLQSTTYSYAILDLKKMEVSFSLLAHYWQISAEFLAEMSWAQNLSPHKTTRNGTIQHHHHGSAIADAVAPKPLDPIEADQRELPLKFDFQSIWGGQLQTWPTH